PARLAGLALVAPGGRQPGARAMSAAPRRSARHGLERLLSKAGHCSRSQARALIQAGRVRVNGVVIVDPEAWFDAARDEIAVDGRVVGGERRRYLALHKPRGYV